MPWPAFLPRRSAPAYRLPDGLRVYAIGDIHGRDDLLAATEERIVRHDAARLPTDESLVVFLGDYVDRGPESAAVIERLARRRFAGLPARFVLGNHEAAMLAFMADPLSAVDWPDWGGTATLASYGVALPEKRTASVLRDAAATLAERMPAAHHAFLRELEVAIELGGFLFVHAGVRPGVPLARQRRDDLLFIREPFLNTRRLLGHRVVHGHTPAAGVELLPHRVGVDTGAYASGRLGVAVIEGSEAIALDG